MKKNKFNIVDLIIIVILVLLIGFIIYRFFNKETLSYKNVKISFCSDYVADYVIDNTHAGDSVIDDVFQVVIGKVNDIQKDKSITYYIDDNGESKIYWGEKKGYSSVKIDVSNTAIDNGNGAIIDGKLYSVGQELSVRAGYGYYNLVVCDLEFEENL